jgi:hypothetical protein
MSDNDKYLEGYKQALEDGEEAWNAGYNHAKEEMKHREELAYQAGFAEGHKEGTKWAIKAIADYEANLLRPIVISKDMLNQTGKLP